MHGAVDVVSLVLRPVAAVHRLLRRRNSENDATDVQLRVVYSIFFFAFFAFFFLRLLRHGQQVFQEVH